MGDYFTVHGHSQFSWLDATGTVEEHVQRAYELGQPAMSLTDHGTMAGAVQLYKATKKRGMAAFPGSEFYVVADVTNPDTRTTRWHLGMLALDFTGYQALTKLSTMSWRSGRFYRKPLIDFADLADLSDAGLSEHIAVTTGCHFGLVIDQFSDSYRSRAMLGMLANWFPNLYVELQAHGLVDQDIKTVDLLMPMAVEMGLPIVAGADSHYVLPNHQPAHDLMKDICYFGDGEDNRFPGGPYHILSEQEVLDRFDPVLHDLIQQGHGDLLDKNRMTMPALDNYRFHVPRVVKDNPDDVLRQKVLSGLTAKGLSSIDYLGRADDELKVIAAMGMANYFLGVQEHVANWCRDNGIIINTRGSANGSLVCFALGITTVDPLQWDVPFDRFLSLDRMKPPDIDVDVSFRGREHLIEHLRAVFPTMVQIGTYARIGLSDPDPDTGLDRGNVVQQYMAAMRRKIPNFQGKVLPEHRVALNALVGLPAYKSMGTNAAGFILPGDDLPIDEYLPLGRIISSDTTLTQMTKDDVEAIGYMKMDILGLRSLQTLNGTLARIGRQPNEWDWIPLDDPKACGLLRSGNGVGLFQYEGWTSARGGKEMKIKNTKDTILGLALYRPALINGGQKDQFLANRDLPRSQQKRLAPFFDSVLDDTAGVPLFQEQILGILRALGMAFVDYNDLMTAIKASNGFIQNAAETFERIQPIFYDLCEDNGLDWKQADDAWDAVVGFTEYGFNRAHATSYGLMSYRSAYLKAHYPLEYMASLLDVWSGNEEKERMYAQEARRLGFRIIRADVNHSLVGWDIDKTGTGLRKGLLSIKGVGEAVAEEIVNNRPPGGYTDLIDFCSRNPARPVTGGRDVKRTGVGGLKGVCKTLYESGAFRSIIT